MRAHELAELEFWDAVVPLVTAAAKTGLDIYSQRQGAKVAKAAHEREVRLMQMQEEVERKRAEAEAARERALLISQQQQAAAGAAGDGFPWLTVGIIGGSVLLVGAVAFLVLRK